MCYLVANVFLCSLMPGKSVVIGRWALEVRSQGIHSLSNEWNTLVPCVNSQYRPLVASGGHRTAVKISHKMMLEKRLLL